MRLLRPLASGQREIVCGIIGDPDKRMLDGEKAEPAMKASVYRLCRKTTNKPAGLRKILHFLAVAVRTPWKHFIHRKMDFIT